MAEREGEGADTRADDDLIDSLRMVSLAGNSRVHCYSAW